MPGHVRKAVFPVAGLGTRFLPATKAIPKEMLPIVDRPLIQYAVEEAKASGIGDLIFVTGPGKDAIQDHFDVSPDLESFLTSRNKPDLLAEVREVAALAATVSSVRQKQALGLGHAILQARDLVGDETFAVLLPDDLIRSRVPVLKQLIDAYERRGHPQIALCTVPREDTAMYGIVGGQPVEERILALTELVEKPAPELAPSRHAIIGRYVLTPDIFPILESTSPDRRGEIQITDGLKTLLTRRPIDGYIFEGERFDAGDKLGYLKATVEYALARPDLGPAFRAFLESVVRR